MNNLKYYQILKENKLLASKNANLKPYNIALLSNCIISQLKEILEYSLHNKEINAKVQLGNYDNILQDSERFKNNNLIIIFWEIINFSEGFHYKVDTLSENQISEIIDKAKSEIDFLFNTLKNSAFVILNKFQNNHFNNKKLDFIASELNNYIGKKVPSNFKIVDTNRIFNNISLDKSTDWQSYYLYKMPYTIDFFKAYANKINPIIQAVQGKAKKVLILDCDNTLWDGILGEDGFDGIQLSQNDKKGAVFTEIQTLALELKKQGVLLCLCSKNNENDINEVLENHPDMMIKNPDITIKKINWDDKASNIKSIAKELNLGLDSFVFVDDSDFEINLIKDSLPEVTAIQVPKNIFSYPYEFRKIMPLFYTLSKTKEDKQRTIIYEQQVEREKEKTKFINIEDYLESLEINLEIFVNEKQHIARQAQMTQKTNQFNLSTIRYTESEIGSFIKNPGFDIISIIVKDKFGDNGITGLVILNYQDRSAHINTFLMSCRIIGRNIEFKLIDYIVNYLKNKNINTILSKYVKTLKNEQVNDFYDKCGFILIKQTDSEKYYSLKINDYKNSEINYINIKNGE
jgi:FkbH-like protein